MCKKARAIAAASLANKVCVGARARIARPSRVTVGGRGRGRPPNSACSAEELQRRKERREQKRADKWKRFHELQDARSAAEEAHAQAKGFADSQSYHYALNRARLPCGHWRPGDRAGKCCAPLGIGEGYCDQAYGEFRADTEEGRAALACETDAAAAQHSAPAPRPPPFTPSPSEWGRVCAECGNSPPPEPGGAHGRYCQDDGFWYCKWCWAEWVHG